MILSNLRERFAECQRSAWRFETQPTYTMPGEQEELEQWRAGKPIPEGYNSAWHERVRGYLADGKSIGRVRVVRRPFTEYQRHQFDWSIPGNIQAGEDIRILDVTELELDLPAHDFWLFDDETVVDLNFNPDGTLINLDQRENPDLLMYRKWRDTALAYAVPFSEFNART
ncbi:hypothetical protein CDG81_19100 [Actinopolyspora erythraea]|uniref:DUF6879 domain-containing protein n=1 Tax=Actinopolyspora erythraea TaxID=414996 RepID=A0A099D8J5_9ACTN|nr:DUF6879 family protein [Actinopolyspora erythraea]ASU80022.1 hypothetical protein CDG81_19100 [Actinopolyspora erythraea]KGI82251.1 hypothetical protein IL38_05815 [Actinopolyspora erythraea]